MTALETLEQAKKRQIDITNKDLDYAIYYGKEHDLMIALPHTEKLTKNFKIYFSKKQSNYLVATIYSGAYTYRLIFNNKQLLFNENGYYTIMGKYQGQKGLHKQSLHRLAYITFYGQPQPGYHIHHIDKNKHNNSMANLVALTEEEHSLVHGRDVTAGRNLFNAQKRTTLISALSEESRLAKREIDRNTILESEATKTLEKKIKPTLLEILLAKATKTNINAAMKIVNLEENTVIATLLKLYKKETK